MGDVNSRAPPTHTFDPDATPQQKAAAAGKARDQLKSIVPKENGANGAGDAGGKEVPIDTGAPAVLPTITISDSDAEGGAPKLQVNGETSPAQDDADLATPEPPGAIPQSKAPEIPDWYVVGWRQHAGLDKKVATTDSAITPEQEADRHVLELFLTEQFYGEWWHNAGIIVFSVLVTHFLTRFHLGIGWILIVLAFCATYYSTSVKRFRRRARDDMQRELVKTQLLKNNPDEKHDVGRKPEVYESAEWLNNFLSRFWLIYEPVLSTTIISSVDQVLSSNCPPFLDSLRLSEFTLGTKAPRIDRVWTFERTDDDIVMMDWALNFTPNEVGDLTQKQLATKVNPKIVLSIRVGKGLATAAMPVLLEDITFSGRIRVRMKLMSNFPHVQIVDLSFMEKPVIDYVLKPIGGETFGFDVANIPGLSSFIREMTHATLSPMMYHPNVFTLNLEQLLSGEALDAAVGVVQIVIHSARGIKGTKIGGGTPDPYVAISIEGRVDLAYTRYKHNTYNPTWMETKFILINNLTENIVFSLYDYNDHRKDSLLGTATFALEQLQDDATHENVVSPLLLDGKDRGELRYDISYYPVLKKDPEGGEEPPDTSVGIVRLTIHQAKDLDASKSLSGDLNPLAKVFLGSNPKQAIHTTKHFKHTLSPVWESSHEFLCANKAGSVITIKVIDDRDFLRDPVIGYMSVRLEDLLLFKSEAGRDWFPLSNCKSGKIRVSAEWKPVDMAGSLHGANDYKKPIGVVRLWLDRATDVKNVEAALGGKSDPYVRVQVANVTKGRTEVVNNNLNPVWDQILYVPVHSLKESLFLECMDYQHLTRDRSLGSVELLVADLAEEDKSPESASYPYKSTGVRNAQDPIRLDKGNSFKGQLHYTAEFIPALNLRNVKFKESEDGGVSDIVFGRGAGGVAGSAGVNASSHTDETGGVVQWKGDGSASVKSFSTTSTSDDEGVPEGVTIKRHGHKKNAKSTDTTYSTQSTGTNAESVHTAETNGTSKSSGTSKKDEEENGVEMSSEELLGQQSGVLVVNVISGNLHKKARLELLLDDGYWPCFSTQKAQSRKAQWEYVGEGFIKELDFGQVWLRLNEAAEGEKDDIIAEWKGDAKSFLKSTLDGPQSFTLMDHEEKNASTIVVESRYVPVPVKLEPRESINNQGLLRVTLLDGRDLRAADRSGKSDPYVVFVLNGQRVHKSETIKKTLNPDWNEDFTMSVPSRVHAEFYCEVYDWDQVGRPDPLGNTELIDLAAIEPFQASELTLPLTLEKHGQKGRIRLRLLFQPEIIVKTRQKTSTFSSAGRAMTQIGGLPVQAGKGVFHGVTSVFKRGDKEEVIEHDEIPSGQTSHAVAPEAFPIAAHERGSSGGNEPGTLRVTVIDGKDLAQGDAKPYAVVRVGDKESKTKHVGKTANPEWNESFSFAASPLTPKIYVWVHDHKTLRKDELLGDGEVDLWRHLNSEQISAAEVSVELHNGNGLVRLRIEYDPSIKFGRQGSMSSGSGERIDRTMSMSSPSPSRFSLRGKRPGQEHDD